MTDISWNNSWRDVQFLKATAFAVDVSFRSWWPWSRRRWRRLVLSSAGHWYWHDTGVVLRLAPQWVWNSLECALEERT